MSIESDTFGNRTNENGKHESFHVLAMRINKWFHSQLIFVLTFFLDKNQNYTFSTRLECLSFKRGKISWVTLKCFSFTFTINAFTFPNTSQLLLCTSLVWIIWNWFWLWLMKSLGSSPNNAVIVPTKRIKSYSTNCALSITAPCL